MTSVLLLAVAPALAAQVSLQADAPSLAEGQSIGLVLTVTDTSIRGGVPRFAVPEGLTAEFESQQQQQLMLNLNLTTSTIYRYTLTALKAGDYTIPALSLPTAVGTLHTEPLSLHEDPRGASTSGANELAGSLSQTPVWVGQDVVYHLRFATDRQMVNGSWIPPEGKGFLLVPGVDPVNTNYGLGEGGSRLAVQDLWVPLQFTQPGPITLPGGALQAQFAVDRSRRHRPGQMEQLFPDLGMFTDVKNEVFSAPSVELNLKPLPTAGRPADFSGLVGQFTISSRVNGATAPTQVKVGDTVTVAIDITGDAPIAGVKLPPLTGDGFRVYDDQPVTNAVIKDGSLMGSASFKRAIVPERPGPLVIPPVTVSAFDPVAGRYVDLTSGALSLDVVGAASTAQVASFAGAPAPTGPAPVVDELLPVRTNPGLTPPWPGRWAFALVVPGALGLLVNGGRGWLARRRAQAGARVRALGFDDLPADPHARLSGLEQIFREAVAPQLGLAAAAVHGEDLARLGPLAGEAAEVYRLIERARYADSDAGSRSAAAATEALEQALRAFVAKVRR